MEWKIEDIVVVSECSLRGIKNKKVSSVVQKFKITSVENMEIPTKHVKQ